MFLPERLMRRIFPVTAISWIDPKNGRNHRAAAVA
jgi:hypothetical protein